MRLAVAACLACCTQHISAAHCTDSTPLPRFPFPAQLLVVVRVIQTELGHLYSNLHPDLHQALFQHMFKAIMASFDSILLNTDEDPTPPTSDEIKGLQEAWFVLHGIFHGDGNGIPEEVLDLLSKRTRDLIT